MASTSSCTMGIKLESKCHKTTYSQEIGLINFDVFSEREKLLLTLRTQIEEISNICYHHKQLYFIKYAMSQRKCADPFKLHKKPHKGMAKLKLSRIVISILLNYFAKLLFRKDLFFSVCHRKTYLYP